MKPATLVLTALAVGIVALLRVAMTPAGEAAVSLPAPVVDNPKQDGRVQTAVLAGGCFWGMQGVFEHVRGVRAVLAGYSGGSRRTAQYQDVGLGNTGHAESVQVTFDPKEISYGELLRIYFSVAHDPTELNRQGPDSGSQYRSQIFYADDSQKHIAQTYIAQLTSQKSFTAPIVTRLDPLNGFYEAENYHQDFYLKNPRYPYIVMFDLPKIQNLKQLFPDYYRESPVTVAAR